MHIRVSKHKKNPETNLLVRKFMAWQIDKMCLKNPGERLAVLFDMTDASLSNVVSKVTTCLFLRLSKCLI